MNSSQQSLDVQPINAIEAEDLSIHIYSWNVQLVARGISSFLPLTHCAGTLS